MKRRKYILDYERRHEALAPPRVFRHRLLKSATLSLGIIAVSLVLGVVGFHTIVGVDSWVDSFYAASMILGGMGPVVEAKSDAAKIFASFYALYSGVVLLASVGVLVSPVLHRVLHRFHLESDDDGPKGRGGES